MPLAIIYGYWGLALDVAEQIAFTRPLTLEQFAWLTAERCASQIKALRSLPGHAICQCGRPPGIDCRCDSLADERGAGAPDSFTPKKLEALP